jgi:hypothetical membrane protein
MSDTRRPLLRFGYPAVAVGVGVVFLATLIDPAFSWETRSLSSIGEATDASLVSADRIAFFLFNGGLILGGLVGLPFVVGLGRALEGRAATAGTALGALTLLGMTGVGVAYLDGPLASLHFPFAFTLFLGLTLTMWTFGSAMATGDDPRFGVLSIWIANAQLLFWIFWIIGEAMVWTDDGDVWTYFAVPEFVAALSFGTWVVAAVRRYA